MKYMALVIVAFFFVACSKNDVQAPNVSKDIKQEINIASNFKNAKDNGKIQTAWLKNFNDPMLELLVKEALKNNRDLRVLKTKVERAGVLVEKASSQLKPSVDLKGAYNSRNTDDLDELSLAGLNVSWEADVWGRLGFEEEASKQKALATASDYEYARQTLVAMVSKAWFSLITSKKQMKYSSDVVNLYKKELDIIKRKVEVGQIEKREILKTKSFLNRAQNAYLSSQNAYENSQRSLELLLGRYPSALIKSKDEVLPIANSIPSGIPSEILERRPDLIAAQQNVASAFYKEQSAELLHLPKFKFSVGISITNLADAVADLVAGIFAPLYTGGAIEAEVKDATILQKQAIENYASKALSAFKEIEDILALEEVLLEQEKLLKQIVEDDKHSLELVKISNDVGQAQYLEVSDAMDKLVKSKIELLDMSNKRLQNRVNLHLALGGGFE